MNTFEDVEQEMQHRPRKWLVTGCAGFIGSNLTEYLLRHDQSVVGLDNLSTGHFRNLEDVRDLVSPDQWRRFSFIQGDTRDRSACRHVMSGVDKVLHQAALGSVPRSIDDPIATNDANVNGFLNVLVAARDAGVESFVYAASSSTYGDHPGLPKVEAHIGRPLSPYAVTKYVNELYADVFARCYGFGTVGLRYFNVFGKRQDPAGAYAAVIPKWIGAMLADHQVVINGDGHTSRDFCFIDNVVQANMLASFSASGPVSRIYNVALGDITTLTQLFGYLKELLIVNGIEVRQQPNYTAFRAGDIMCSQANIEKAMRELGYVPRYRIREGLAATVPWYVEHIRAAAGAHQQAGASAERYATAE